MSKRITTNIVLADVRNICETISRTWSIASTEEKKAMLYDLIVVLKGDQAYRFHLVKVNDICNNLLPMEMIITPEQQSPSTKMGHLL
jgi:hypothetical protein